MTEIYSSTTTATKKRLMFFPQEDFYYLTYCSLLLLDGVGATASTSLLSDHRKLSFLIDFASSYHLSRLLLESFDEDFVVHDQDKKELQSAYTRAKDRLPFLNRLIFSLEKRGYVNTVNNVEEKITSIYLVKNNIPDAFFSSELFNSEKNNIMNILVAISRVRTLSLKTLLERMFRKNGVTTWLD